MDLPLAIATTKMKIKNSTVILIDFHPEMALLVDDFLVIFKVL